MLVLCAIVIFSLTIIALLVIAGRYAKKQVDTLFILLGITNAGIDRNFRMVEAFKADIDAKFGPDLIKKLNAIFKLGEHPKNIVLGQDGKFHKNNREY